LTAAVIIQCKKNLLTELEKNVSSLFVT
jgi:hypothetical protein